MNLGQFIEANKGLIEIASISVTAIATLGLLVATAILAVVTQRLFREQQRQGEPKVVVSMEPHARQHNVVCIIIENIGGGLAKNVQIEMLDEIKIGARSLQNLSFYTQHFLKPKVSVTSAVGTYFELEEKNKKTRFRVAYQNASGKKFLEIFNIDLTLFEGIWTIGEKTIDDVAKNLDKISKTLQSTRMKVDVFDADCRQKENKAHSEWRDSIKNEEKGAA